MKTSQSGLDLIKSSEGCRLKTYRCQAGVLTVGYGHTGPDVFDGQEITQEEADTLLRLDLARFEAAVKKTCHTITQCQFNACVSLCYNIGAGAFAKSSVARLHNEGRYGDAAQAFMLWNKAGGKVSRGLQSRRAKESALYLSDEISEESYVPPSTAEGEKPLSESKTLQGQIGAAAATAGAVGAGQIDSAIINEHSNTVVMMLPYIKEYWWVFAVAAAGFVAYSIYARVKDRIEGRN
jgi:lysozyme